MPQNIREMWGYISRIFEKDGDLSQSLTSFESRPGQKEMAQMVFQSLVEDSVAVVEAGTGTGKTLAYLIPAVIFSLANNEPVVVSTKTINLQEQIVFKDIPIARKVVGQQFRAAIAKGWNNYVCLRRYKGLKVSQEQFSPQEYDCYKALQRWLEGSESGDRSDMDFEVEPAVWEAVVAEPAACNNRRCPYFENCFFFRHRSLLRNANIIVTNHALLFSHFAAARRTPNQSSGILPEFSRLILDEAHHVEDVASAFLGLEASLGEFYRILNNLYFFRSSQDEAGILMNIRKERFSPSVNIRVQALLDSFCIPNVRTLRDLAGQLFYNLIRLPSLSLESDRVLLTDSLKSEAGGEFEEDLQYFLNFIGIYKKNLAQLREEIIVENEDFACEVSGMISRLEIFVESLVSVWNADDESWIYSLEYSRGGKIDRARLKSYPLMLADIIYESLLQPLKSVVFTSATISINRNFKYLYNRLGLDRLDRDLVKSLIIDSPFDYKKQAVMAIPVDMPMSDQDNFLLMVLPHLARLVRLMEGRTFILFTSYKMLEQCGRMLKERLRGENFNLFIQGEAPRHILLDNFKNEERSILLGTDSFWEGVDVPGRDLECVVIVKLPFKVPTDPITRAVADYMESRGINSFNGYYVPQAVIRFKQGFGRLIRNRNDRGTVIILDKRVIEKPYGRTFLKSLPRCRLLRGSFGGIINFIDEWHKK